MVIPPGVEPGLLPWKSSVLTSWPRDHIYKAQLRIFLHPKNINLVIKILLYVPLWSLVSLGRFELPVHWLKVSCVTSYATGSDILDGCFAANKHYHRLEEWILLRQCSTLHENLMLTGKWVVYLRRQDYTPCRAFMVYFMSATTDRAAANFALLTKSTKWRKVWDLNPRNAHHIRQFSRLMH